MNDATINKLVNSDPSHISAPVLRAAVEKLAQEQKERQTREAIAHLSHVEALVNDAVNNLRRARKQEAKAKAYLVALGAAQTQFHKDGNKTAFDEAAYKARRTFVYGRLEIRSIGRIKTDFRPKAEGNSNLPS